MSQGTKYANTPKEYTTRVIPTQDCIINKNYIIFLEDNGVKAPNGHNIMKYLLWIKCRKLIKTKILWHMSNTRLQPNSWKRQLEQLLNLFKILMTMFSFYILWKHQQTTNFLCSKGFRKKLVAWNRLIVLFYHQPIFSLFTVYLYEDNSIWSQNVQ